MEEDVQGQESGASSSAKSSEVEPSTSSTEQLHTQWSPGDKCMAVWAEDHQ